MGIVDQAKALRAAASKRLLPQKFVFHHVPKCGGTSVGRALRKRYLLSQATVRPDPSFRAFETFSGRSDREAMLIDVAALREQMLLYHLHDDVHCISLHVAFSNAAYAQFCESYKFVTILREPVERFISHYFWSYKKPGDFARIDEDFETFLNSERAHRMGASYVEYYSGQPMAKNLADPNLINQAVANLHGKFDVVGHLNDLQGFTRDLQRELGIRIRIGHENKARQPQADRSAVITPELMERAREVCAPDITVWNAIFGQAPVGG